LALPARRAEWRKWRAILSPDRERASRLDFGGRAVVYLGSAFLRAIGSTWRIEIVGEDEVSRLGRSRVGGVFALWHGQLLPLIWHNRDRDVSILVSEHRDGEMIARVAQSLGYGVIRGSTTRGGGRAILEVVSAVRSGRIVAITPDGPRGPAKKVAPGPLIAAQRSAAPLVPAAAWASAAWRLSSWDSFMIPKPFAKIRIAYGEPIHVSDQSARGAALRSAELEQAMADAEAKVCGV
jgi:lysophospholipid acyltransferase (LPLAT)-like uncharacterized protein